MVHGVARATNNVKNSISQSAHSWHFGQMAFLHGAFSVHCKVYSIIFGLFRLMPVLPPPTPPVVVQSLSRVRLFVTPWTAAHQASLSFTISQMLLKLMSIESVMPSNHPVFCLPLLPLPSIFPSIRVFSNESNLHITWPEYWSFSISPSNEYSGLISFRIDWFYLL